MDQLRLTTFAMLLQVLWMLSSVNQDTNKTIIMKKILFSIILAVVATTAVTAQKVIPSVGNNDGMLLHYTEDYLYYGNQVMTKKECVNFLAERHQPAYEKFANGYKCYKAGWWTLGAGLGLDLVGIVVAVGNPKGGNEAMLNAGIAIASAGLAAVVASVPTIFVGYARMREGVNMFNASQDVAPQAYWTIQGSQNGIGLALHF